ncbi:MAG TPA: hypothetical protein VG538_16975 [Vicinamibacterales bacterium]|nr:hypothetical protein [Vicinamibacterales bacterium]
MQPEDRVRVAHMIDAADALASFIRGRVRADLDTDVVWNTASTEIPALVPALTALRDT